MGVSKTSSKDEAAFNLILLQLSNQKKSLKEMEKEMVKNERI